jgi:hypothetical protein
MPPEADPADPNPSFSHAAHEIVAPAEDEDPALFRDQELRKQWADKRLQMQGVRTLDWLPCIEGEAETRLRSPQEVAARLQAVTLVAVKAGRIGYGDSPATVQKFIEKVIRDRDMESDFSPEELRFMQDPKPEGAELARLSWGWEAAYVLAWALKLVEPLPSPPRDTCDTAALEHIVSDEPDLAARGLRPANDILNQADLIYRYHWAASGDRWEAEAPHPRISAERHQALNWLIRVADADWDDVPTDT